MRTFPWTSFGLLTALTACSSPRGDADAPAASRAPLASTAAVASTFVTLSAPQCAPASADQTPPPCTYTATSVNETVASTPVAKLVFPSSFTPAMIAYATAAPLDEIVLRGTFVPVANGSSNFSVLEAYRGQPGLTFNAHAGFYQAGSLPATPGCDASVCVQGDMNTLNLPTSTEYDSIDVTAAVHGQVSAAWLQAQIVSFNAIVAGAIPTLDAGRNQPGNAVLTASQVFVKLPFAGEDVPRLGVNGTAIVDPTGAPIVLRGWNWGQWGTVQPGDGQHNVTEGANVVRIPLRWWGQYGALGAEVVDSRSGDKDAGYIDPGHLAELDAMVKEAASQKLWIDLFLDSDCGQDSANDTVAYCNAPSDAGPPLNFANDSDAREQFTEAWEFLVRHYQNQPYIGMYEILAEPQFGCADGLCVKSFYRPIIDRIRAIDPVTPILIGGGGGYDIQQLAPAYIDEPGLIYTGDFLNSASGHVDWVSTYATSFQTAHDVPVFIQQVGSLKEDTTTSAPDGGTLLTTGTDRAGAILDALNDAGLGWTWWTYREQGTTPGKGFAPYQLINDGGPDSGEWMEDKSFNPTWLTTISSRMPQSH